MEESGLWKLTFVVTEEVVPIADVVKRELENGNQEDDDLDLWSVLPELIETCLKDC
jgi:hypothetical protein